jgi:hypothetical protein
MNFISPKINLMLKYQLIVLVGIFIVLEGLLIYNFYYVINQLNNQAKLSHYRTSPPAVANDLIKRRIDGVEVEEGKENLYPVAVNIDNHFDSWPNYGLSQASLVYEAPVEGSTTRFLAFYTPDINNPSEISKIGPVRSTRPYFVELAKEYDALLGHSGGSAEALKRIEELGVNNLEEIAWWGPDYYWRVYSRAEPHNLFTSSHNLAQAVVDWQLAGNLPDYRNWKFNQQIDLTKYTPANEISLDLSQADVYDVSYKYASSTKNYLRWQGDEDHIDALNNQQIGVKNLVVQYIPQKIVLDSEGRIKLNLIGKGEAIIFRDGVKIEGSWRKLDYNSRTIFYNQDGEEIEFRPGNIWIEIIPGKREVNVK